MPQITDRSSVINESRSTIHDSR